LARLTGERPVQGVTPDSLLALHDAGYRAVIERLGVGKLLDLGCGQGFESVRLVGPGRNVVGVDRSLEAVSHAALAHTGSGFQVARCDALRLCLGGGTFDYACSSHLIEHFERPEGHVSEMARVLKPRGQAFVVTPNRPADFENPFHVHLFGAGELTSMLGRFFTDVWVGGLDGTDAVKADFRARRERAAKVLGLDVLDLRHRIPRSWYVGAYTRVLPVVYRFMARGDSGGSTGLTADDFFVTDEVDDTTLVLFAIASGPRPPLR
jgi:SAM-dependent methyltransferase